MSATRKRRDGRATMDRVIEFARAELAEHGPMGFNLDRVIASSGVSRGSIYHHFGNRAGLITAVEAIDLLATYHEGNVATRQIIEAASSGSELNEWLTMAIRFGSGEAGRRGRARRIATLAASDQIPALREVLAENQRSGIDYYVESLEIARSKGLIDPVLDLRAIANLIQSVVVGRVLVDLLDDPDDDEGWVTAAVVMISGVLGVVDGDDRVDQIN